MLENDFQVSQKLRKCKTFLPQLKVNNLETDQFDSYEQLQELITRKSPYVNEILRNITKSNLTAMLTDRNFNFSVVKVTPGVGDESKETSRFLIKLDSFYVIDHYHDDFRQKSLCRPNKDKHLEFLYCAGVHWSKMCSFKNNTEKTQACELCKISDTWKTSTLLVFYRYT